MPDDNAQAADDTRRLRARFPRWGILFDPLESVWIAVRGKRTLVAASSPEKLTEQVEAAARGEAGPDEGDKTQTWRALRKQRRGLPAATRTRGTRPPEPSRVPASPPAEERSLAELGPRTVTLAVLGDIGRASPGGV
jgi:hypothetical protein